MNTKSFSWCTEFKSIIIVDNELFHNIYKVKIGIRPVTDDLEEQTQYFDRLKFLYTYIVANTIITGRDEDLYKILAVETNNRFIELPRPPYDQIMAAVLFAKSNAILEGKIIVDSVELSSYQGDGISYTVTKEGSEIELLDVDKWFSTKYNKFDPWWLRPDTATYDKELAKGIYTGHFSWQDHNEHNEPKADPQHEENAKIFEFNPRVLDGGKGKKK
jgi:hypothetical protein|tara:strand:- start:2392 stop:3042 length:651 start_codon:yes stop_codon:yes gene_type:complete